MRRPSALAAELVAGWLAAVDRAEARGFSPLGELGELCRTALADSCFWGDELFAPGAHPTDPALGARHEVHLATSDTPDLVRHTYAAKGLALVVIEGRNFALVRVARASVDVLALPAAARPGAIRRAAAALLVADPLRLPRGIAEGATFSTAPAASPLFLAHCRHRTDGGIRRGELYLLAYKKIPQRVGYADARQWFGDAFRDRFARTGGVGMGDKTLASFDAATQAKATDILGRFTGIYRISGNLIHATELGAAVEKALADAGGDSSADAFEKSLDEGLLRLLHTRMVEEAAKGCDVESGLEPEAYAKLRRGLEQKYGPLGAA